MTTTTDKRISKWLEGVSDPKGFRSSRFDFLAGPILIQWEGETYTAACDGRIMLLVQGSHAEKESSDQKAITKTASGLLSRSDGWRSVALRKLSNWAGDAPPVGTMVCGECGGGGRTICEHCERDGECPECFGDGEVRHPFPNICGLICGTYVNLSRLAALLRGATDETVEYGARKDCLCIKGQGWTGLLMSVIPAEPGGSFGPFDDEPPRKGAEG